MFAVIRVRGDPLRGEEAYGPCSVALGGDLQQHHRFAEHPQQAQPPNIRRTVGFERLENRDDRLAQRAAVIVIRKLDAVGVNLTQPVRDADGDPSV